MVMVDGSAGVGFRAIHWPATGTPNTVLMSQSVVLYWLGTARNHPTQVQSLAEELNTPNFPNLLRDFLSQQLNVNAGGPRPATFTGHLKVYHSTAATFISPSDPCSVGRACCEQIKATPSWFHGPEHYDTVFVNTDDTHEDMQAMEVAQIICFFSLPCTNGVTYPCALIHWFDYVVDEPDELTGMWMVKPSFLNDNTCYLSIVHIDTIVRAAHLILIFGQERVPLQVNLHNSLDVYQGFYVNHFIDHHAFELVF